jgi:histidinol phosphatase-like PHP family hydrolase
MSSARVDIIDEAKSTHESESIDFALFVLSGKNFNQFPEATKQYLREKVRKEYNKFFGHPTGRVLFAKMCEAVDKIKLEL